MPNWRAQQAVTPPAPQRLQLADFSGGWNPRDAPSQVADNEAPDCWNISFDERGGAVKRLGLTKMGATQLTNAPAMIFYSRALAATFVQDGTALKKTTDFTSYTTVKTFTTSARVGITDFTGKIIVVHPVDGVWSYDNATFTSLNTTVVGNSVAAWQNKVWVSGGGKRVWFSAVGDPATWSTGATGDWIDVREGGDDDVTQLLPGPDQDEAGRGGLLVFKRFSTHRIHDSAEGNYTTISTVAGAASSQSAIALHQSVFSISETGVWATDGVNPSVNVSEKLSPLFVADQITFAQRDRFCAGAYRDRVLFSVPWDASTTNNLTLEYHPLVGWFAPHGFGATSFTRYTADTDKTLSANPDTKYIYDTFTGGSDDGSNIEARFQTKWFETSSAFRNSFRSLTVAARGEFNLFVKIDYTTSEGTLHQVSLVNTESLWGSAIWGVDMWTGSNFEDYQRFYSLGTGRAISFELQEVGTSSGTGGRLLDTGSAATVGAFALYGIYVDYVSFAQA